MRASFANVMSCFVNRVSRTVLFQGLFNSAILQFARQLLFTGRQQEVTLPCRYTIGVCLQISLKLLPDLQKNAKSLLNGVQTTQLDCWQVQSRCGFWWCELVVVGLCFM